MKVRQLKFYRLLAQNFRPSPSHLNLNIHSSRQIKIHQGVNGFGIRVHNINQALMHAHFKLFSGIFMYKRRTVYRIFMNFGRKRNRADNVGSLAAGSIHNLLNRRIYDFIIIGAHLYTDALFNFLFSCFFNCRCQRTSYLRITNFYRITNTFIFYS